MKQRRHMPRSGRFAGGRARRKVGLGNDRDDERAKTDSTSPVMARLAPNDVLALQRTAGNSATCDLLARPAGPPAVVVRRTVETAAQALDKAGVITVKRANLKGPFLKAHDVTIQQMGEIQTALDGIRQAAAAGKLQEATARKLGALKADSSGVKLTHGGVEVHLDNDQLKHQPPGVPIGVRTVSGGNLFKDLATAAWHQTNTMVYMATWAAGLPMVDGDNTPHGQMRAVDGIHYEGYCLMASGKKYVSFHCYPADGDDRKAAFKK